jgi:hypothetical protein
MNALQASEPVDLLRVTAAQATALRADNATMAVTAAASAASRTKDAAAADANGNLR